MKKYKILYLFIVFCVLVLFFMNLVFNRRNYKEKINLSSKDLINISDLSKKYMVNYFEGVKKLSEEDNNENIVIVISKNKIKDGYGATSIVEGPNNQYYLQYKNEYDRDNAMENFKNDENIVSFEKNIIYHTNDDNNSSSYNSWGITKMRLDKAINFLNNKSDVNNVNVAIIDTGCNMDLFNSNYSNKIADTFNLYDNSNSMFDNFGHGTHVAGTIAEGTSNNVKLVPIKVSDNGSIDNVKVIAAINWIVYNKKADIINMSFGGYIPSEAEYQAIEAAKENNIISVAAAGNDNISVEHYPSSFDNTISISSVDNMLNKSDFSNYGSTISFAAPGTGILSINGRNSGTSMAAPHASSAVAAIKSLNKNVTFENTIDLLKTSVLDIGSEGFDDYFGNGFITFDLNDFCDGNNCDNYNVFKKKSGNSNDLVKMEVVSENTSITYNYGNITNLMGLQVKLYYNSSDYYIRYLGQLDNVEINNYNAYSYTNQNVEIKYRGLRATVLINNTNAKTNGFEYEKINSNNIRLTKFLYDVKPYKVIIPDNIDGYVVKELGDSLFEGQEVISVVMSNTITNIGKAVFKKCVILENVVLSNQLEEISEEAFMESGIKKIILPDSVVAINNYAFSNCSKLQEVYISKNVERIDAATAFDYLMSIEKIEVAEDNRIYDSRNDCNALIETSTNKLLVGSNKTVIPDNIEIIEDHAFVNRTGINKIIIPESVKSIGVASFWGTNLEEIYIPKNVESIGNEAFSYTFLKKITVDEDNRAYDSRNNCNAVIETETNELVVGGGATIIPNTVTSIGNEAFRQNRALTKINIPSSVVEIKNGAFYQCSSLYDVKLSNNLNTIGEYAFALTDIRSIEIPASVENIDNRAFFYSTNLENVTLHEGLKRIENYAFASSVFPNKIEHITLPNTLEEIGEGAFYTSQLKEINIPKSVNSIGDMAFLTNKLDNVTVDKENKIFDSRDNCNGIIETSNNKLVFGFSKTKIPYTVKVIGKKSFSGWGNLISKIVIPEGVEIIEEGAFNSISADKVVLPSSITHIDSNVIYGDDYARSIVNFYVYDNTYSKSFVVNNNYKYKIMDELVNFDISLNKNTYSAFDKVDIKNIKASYKDNVTETLSDNYIIVYNNGNDSFRYGDNKFTLYAITGRDYPIKKEVNVTVNKAIPNYDIPSGLEAKEGQKLKEISLPNGFSWKDENETISRKDKYLARYVPEDTDNYEIVDVEIPILVERSNVIIKFVSNDSSAINIEQKVEINKDVNLLENSFEGVEGYKFDSWNTKEDGSGVKYTDKQSVKLNDDLILYAQWVPIKYKVKFKPEENSNNEIVQEFIYNKSQKLRKNEFTKNKYKFISWEGNCNGKNCSFSDEENVLNLSSVDGSVIELVAKWEYNFIKVSFNSNGGTGIMNEVEIPKNSDYIVSESIFEKKGYIFKTWNTKADGSGINIDVGSKYNPDSNMTLYAQWEPIQYKIIFNSNNSDNIVNEQILSYDSEVKLNKNNFNFKDHKFDHWNTKSDDKGIVYNDEQLVKNILDKNNETITLYAIWKEVSKYETEKYKVDVSKKYIGSIDENTTVDEFKKSIIFNSSYSIDVDTIVVNNKEVLHTGGKTKLYYNNNLDLEFTNIVTGDTDGNGIVDYFDCSNVFNHIRKLKNSSSDKELLKNEYLIAADVSYDDKVTYMDYVKMYNKIKASKGGERN